MNHFYAFLNRMKYIERWNLMHSTVKENISEHSQNVAVIAHALALIENLYFHGQVDEYKTLCYAVYHEASEVITGDLPTPIKYFNAQIKTAYKDLESYAVQKLLCQLPQELKTAYQPFLVPDLNSREYTLSKASDKLCAYIKCMEELSAGNLEFKKASSTIEKELKAIDIPAVQYFITHFIPSFKLTLDELE